MPAHRKTSLAQIMELIVYLEKHKDIQLGIVPPKGLGRKENEHWQKLSLILNRCPGEPKDAGRWKSYWNELKWHCRKKAAEGRHLLPHEKRVMALVGSVRRYPVYVIPNERELKIELEENNTEQKQDDTFNVYGENDYTNSGLPDSRDQDCTSPEPMPMVDISVEACHSVADQDEQEEEVSLKAEEEPLPSEDVPEWVRKVEHSRLALEERTTRAIEQMSAGITSISEAMHSIVGSLHSIEASIRGLNNKS